MTNETKTYNGWTNYETWNVALWMDNEQGAREYWQNRATNWVCISKKTPIFSKLDCATADLAAELKEDFAEENPLNNTNSCYVDLLNAALSNVNWYEISKDLINSVCHEVK